MSIALMNLAWKSSFSSGKKLVLLALCDNANDQGECFPSISMLSEKCSMSERSVFSHIADLQKDGAIQRETRPGRSTIYHLDPCKFCTPTPANSAPLPLQILPPTPATVAPTPANSAPITTKEPSSNHHKYKKSSGAFDAGLIDLPEWLNRETWGRWVKDRKTRNKPITEEAARLQIKKLLEHLKTGFTPETVIDNAIENGWQGLYEPKNKPRTATRHSGFSGKNYREGASTDGSLI